MNSTGKPVQLPIHEIRESLAGALRQGGPGRVVLTAPTGSGKSTQVPQYLIDDGLVPAGQEVLILQPRRLPARMLARRVASERGSRLGAEVGYAVRFDRQTSRETRIIFLTEGLFLRRLLTDPQLKGVGAVVFDEFHERHLDADLTLGLVRDLQRDHRPDLRIIVMSATLEVAGLEEFLNPCVVIESAGRTFPVEIRHFSADRDKPVWERAASATRQLVQGGFAGDILIFMPGAGEIRQTIRALQENGAAKGRLVLPLYGDLPPDQQDAAVTEQDRPRIVVSTNVAETSLTIPGITAVIDSGQARIPRHDPRRGIDTLLVEPISQASAQQRAGRAGRTAPGVCIQLWSETDHRSRPAQLAPEIARVDLSEAVLNLRCAGFVDLAKFPWFEAPPDDAFERAHQLLRDLGALDAQDTVTKIGRKMAVFPAHPRYARLFLAAHENRCLQPALLIAAFAQGRSILLPINDKRREKVREERLIDALSERSDFFVQLRAWNWAAENRFDPEFCRSWGIHGQASRQAAQVANQFARLAEEQGLNPDDVQNGEFDPEALQKAVLAAFSDHLARRRDQGTLRCDLIHGRNAELQRDSAVTRSPLFVAAEIEERQIRGDVVTLLGLATAVEQDWLRELFPADFSESIQTRYDERQRRVVAQRELRFRDLVLETPGTADPDPETAARLLADRVLSGEIELKNWNDKVEQWIARLNLVAREKPEYGLQPIEPEDRRMLIEQICFGAFSHKDLKEREVLSTVKSWISQQMWPVIDQLTPAEITLPGRNRPCRIRYDQDGGPTIAVILQDLYDIPGNRLRILENRIPLRIEILAPSRRPIQVTQDLDAFWKTSYEAVKKDLKGRYPKHEWR